MRKVHHLAFRQPRQQLQLCHETLAEGHYRGLRLQQAGLENRNCEIGIFIGDEEYQNKGFGTDAMKILIRLCFNS